MTQAAWSSQLAALTWGTACPCLERFPRWHSLELVPLLPHLPGLLCATKLQIKGAGQDNFSKRHYASGQLFSTAPAPAGSLSVSRYVVHCPALLFTLQNVPTVLVHLLHSLILLNFKFSRLQFHYQVEK